MATKPFAGKDDRREEMAEARSVRSGRVSPKQYAAKERSEGEKGSRQGLEKTGKALASGKMSPSAYAKGRKC